MSYRTADPRRVAALALLLLGLMTKPSGGESWKPGLWQETDSLRNYAMSADGLQIASGGAEPKMETHCLSDVASAQEYDRRRIELFLATSHCRLTVISDTAEQLDKVLECPRLGARPPYVVHMLVFNISATEIVSIRDMTTTTPGFAGRISRSAIYRRSKWLKADCKR